MSNALLNISADQVEMAPPTISQLSPPPRLMLGPGPSNAHPRVYAAMAIPQVGHMDGYFLGVMEDIKQLLQYVWQTTNPFTIAVSGTGSAAWEACHANLTEEGDVTLCAVNGYFGERACDMASRYGADVRRIDKPWGQVFSLEEITAAIEEHKPKLFWIAHAETSTGACQPLEGISAVCRANDCLLVVDTVTSIGGLPIQVDKWGIDACYAGGQKCLSCPPGASPLTLGPRALERMGARKTPVKNWYLDMTMIQRYLVVEGGAPRVYHHTAPISMMFALREALRIVAEETLPATWARHRATAELLWAGLEQMGLSMHVAYENRLPSLTTVRIPEGVDGKAVCGFLLRNYNLEIAGGLGQLGGQVWRIGMMGYNSRAENVRQLLACLAVALADQGYTPPASA